MRGQRILHQTLEYPAQEPFVLMTARYADVDHPFITNSHWHEELEIVYILQGRSLHYIDGECVCADAGRLVTVNSESVHRISVDATVPFDPQKPSALILMISRPFLQAHFPEYEQLRFTNTNPKASPQTGRLLEKCAECWQEGGPLRPLRMRGLLVMLLCRMCEECAEPRGGAPQRAANSSQLKNILTYIGEHYNEPLAQADVAARFYFTPQYFSRFFKQCTGVTFTEHLTACRLQAARRELVHTDKSVAGVALDTGFSDERCFINAFKRCYQMTPLQYRRSVTEGPGRSGAGV